MKIAFTSKGTKWESMIDARFGRTDFIVLFDEESKEIKTLDNREIENEAHGAGPKTAKKLFDLNPDVLITGNGPGGNAAQVLEKAGTDIYIGANGMNLEEAYKAYQNNQLNKF